MPYRKLLVLLSFTAFNCVAHISARDVKFDVLEYGNVQLENPPIGCVIRLYNLDTKYITDPKSKKPSMKFLTEAGLTFPKGGYVTYIRKAHTLIICSTVDDLDLL